VPTSISRVSLRLRDYWSNVDSLLPWPLPRHYFISRSTGSRRQVDKNSRLTCGRLRLGRGDPSLFFSFLQRPRMGVPHSRFGFPKRHKLPIPIRCGCPVTENVEIAVVGPKLEECVFGAVPLIDHFLHEIFMVVQ
jgi:hypothetical protein